MGVDYVLFERLAELSTRFKPVGRSLGLGRHTFKIESSFAPRYEKAIKENGLEGKRFDYLQDDGYYETLMRKMGFGEMESMDFSDYEGATIIHDLSKPVPDDLEEQFDFIFDGGTVERLPGSAISEATLQSDYEVKWAGHENAGKIRLDGAKA